MTSPVNAGVIDVKKSIPYCPHLTANYCNWLVCHVGWMDGFITITEILFISSK